MANSKNRWELEEKRRKQEQEKARQAVLNAAKTQSESWKEGAAARRNTNTSSGTAKNNTYRPSSSGNKMVLNKSAPSAKTQKSSASSSSGSSGSSGTQQKSFGLQGLQNLPLFGAGSVSSAGSSLHRVGSTTREDYLAGGAARRRSNMDSRTGTNTSRGTQREEDEKNLQLNMARWHMTDDQAERDRLHQANNAIRARLGLAYDNGTTYDPRTGRN